MPSLRMKPSSTARQGHEHTPVALETLSRRHGGTTQRSARVCIWRRHYPGHGLLPARKQTLQRLDALRAERGLYSALLRDSKDLDGYAFALGALSHYAADNDGHLIGVNRAVPILYPNLKKKYGDLVTYEESPLAHVKTEFRFDVLEVAQGRYAPDSYHDFIGFAVSVPLLEQAFQETYGLDLKSVLSDEDKVLGSYRHDVSQLLPKATRVAWSLKKDDIMKDQPGITKKKFLYNLSRASYQKNWGNKYQPPTLGERFLAFLTRIVPKIGPLRVLQLRTPTPETERMFEASFNAAMDRYRKLLGQADSENMILPNDNFDTGDATGPGKYRLDDEAHAELLDALAKQGFATVPPELRAELFELLRASGCSLCDEAQAKGVDESSGPT